MRDRVFIQSINANQFYYSTTARGTLLLLLLLLHINTALYEKDISYI